MFHAIANFFRRCCRKRPVTSGVSDLARERMSSGGEALKKDVITQTDEVTMCLFEDAWTLIYDYLGESDQVGLALALPNSAFCFMRNNKDLADNFLSEALILETAYNKFKSHSSRFRNSDVRIISEIIAISFMSAFFAAAAPNEIIKGKVRWEFLFLMSRVLSFAAQKAIKRLNSARNDSLVKKEFEIFLKTHSDLIESLLHVEPTSFKDHLAVVQALSQNRARLFHSRHSLFAQNPQRSNAQIEIIEEQKSPIF